MSRAVLMSRNLEDSVTWVDSSKIKRNIMKYSDKVYGHRQGLTSSLMISICCRFEVLEPLLSGYHSGNTGFTLAKITGGVWDW